MSKRRVVFIVTQDCQLRCNYCYLINKNNNKKMTWKSAKKIADFLLSLPVIDDTVIFDFIGGEPLIEIGLISRISDYLVSEMKRLNHPWIDNYSFRFTTNGLLYSNSRVQEYIEKYKNCLSIQISIDGTKRKHDLNRIFPNGTGSYDKLLPNVKLWIKQFGENARTFMVISHEDLPYLSESVIHHLKLGIKDIYISLVVEDVWKNTDDIIFEKELMIVADYVIDNLMSQGLMPKVTLPIVIDTEASTAPNGDGRADGISKADRTAAIKGFTDRIKQRGYTPMIYASPSWLQEELDLSQLSDVKIWLAHWTHDIDKRSNYTGVYEAWQYTNKGSVSGINGLVDRNVSFAM